MADGWRCDCGRRNDAGATYCGSCYRGRPAGVGVSSAPVAYFTTDEEPEYGPPLPPAPERRFPVAVIATAVVAVIAVFGGILLTSGGDGDDDVASTAVATTVPFDGGMQLAVEEMSAYVARVRGLPFKEPVKATLLNDEEFEARLRSGAPVDRAEIEGRVATLRALGLLPPDFNLEQEEEEDVSSVLGFYDPEVKELFVRGRSVSSYVKFVLVHELTHALQDQHFDLARFLVDDGDVGLAHRTLIEGDAEDIGRDYISTLSPFEQDLVAREARQRGDDLYGQSFYLSFVNFPYVAGKQFVRELATGAGTAQVDQAYANPPQSTEQILDISRYRAGDAPKPVAAPAAGGAVVDQGDIGYFELAFLLLEAMSIEQAVYAIDGWGGSQYVTWRSGTRSCTRVRFVGDTAGDTAELASALQIWASVHGGASASGATITACA